MRAIYVDDGRMIVEILRKGVYFCEILGKFVKPNETEPTSNDPIFLSTASEANKCGLEVENIGEEERKNKLVEIENETVDFIEADIEEDMDRTVKEIA